MRQRITYLLPNGTGVDPADITVSDTELTYAQAHNAAEERRITIGYDELLKEVQTILRDFHELHIRIASWQNYAAFSPTVSRVSPGLHAFFTPLKQKDDSVETSLCSNLRKVLGDGVKCSNTSSSFSKPPVLSERFASSSTYQYYHQPSDLLTLNGKLQGSLCPQLEADTPFRQLCNILSSTTTASYLDLDFDVISHALTITILWPASTTLKDQHKPLSAGKFSPSDRLEVGIISPEKSTEPESLTMAGFLTVVGEDKKPKATMFSFPARHHPLPAGSTYTAKFQAPTGLHPKLEITIPRAALPPPKEESACALHAYWTLPSTLFIDKYQFTDSLFLASQNLVALRAISGEQDLEAPEWVIEGWGSASLFEVAHPSSSSAELAKPDDPSSPGGGEAWTITIPTHLRYINATGLTSPSGHAELEIPWPVVFWACEAEEGLKMGTNPFDRVNLGYDGLFGPKTMFYHLSPKTAEGGKENLLETLKVPVLDPESESAQWAPVGTMLVVMMGFAWIMWALMGPIGKKGKGEKVSVEKEK